MKKISVWARRNKKKARLLIVLIHLALFYLGIEAGRIFWQLDIILSIWILCMALLVYVSAIALYPKKTDPRLDQDKEKSYRTQKTTDFLLGLSAFVMISFLSNQYFSKGESEISGFFVNMVRGASIGNPVAGESVKVWKYGSVEVKLSRHEKKMLKREFFKQFVRYAKARATGDSVSAGQVLLIMLTIIAAVGLLALLASLACSLSCSGSGAAAILVAIVGITGIVMGTIGLIHLIRGKRSVGV
jgi:hypothetical protein